MILLRSFKESVDTHGSGALLIGFYLDFDPILEFLIFFLRGFSNYVLRGVVPLFVTYIGDLINKISLLSAPRI